MILHSWCPLTTQTETNISKNTSVCCMLGCLETQNEVKTGIQRWQNLPCCLSIMVPTDERYQSRGVWMRCPGVYESPHFFVHHQKVSFKCVCTQHIHVYKSNCGFLLLVCHGLFSSRVPRVRIRESNAGFCDSAPCTTSQFPAIIYSTHTFATQNTHLHICRYDIIVNWCDILEPTNMHPF